MPDTLRQSPQPDVPTYDYLEQRNLDEYGDLEWLLEDLIRDIEEGYFLQWEMVIRQEQGQKLTRRQRKLLKKLIYFGDDPDDRILYIDGIARPSEPWYEIIRKVASKLLLKKFKTFEVHYAAATEGWPRLVECLEKYGSGLSLPEGAKSPVDIVPEHTRHQLWLQACFDALSGLGQDDILTLEDNDQHYRIEWFIEDLKKHKESVQFLNLTLDALLSIVILPPKDEAILAPILLEKLGLSSAQEPLADAL